MMGIARFIGRGRAHELISELCRRAQDEKRPLVEVLAETPEIGSHLDRQALERLCDPANYLGSAGAMVDRVLAILK
jgi:3-carboxy-cis,cis-muconate cycloisomerase